MAEAEQEDTSSWVVEGSSNGDQPKEEIPLETEVQQPTEVAEDPLSLSVIKEESTEQLADQVENYDPTLDLPRYKISHSRSSQ